ncbi:MAG TPA: phosphatidylinositol-specific phospholipase C domain-containing protein [Actinospica sp.]|nr:phosphatidylinositol-specific phospholipase C domain-containing protein [Actinospica sp.]
MPLYASARNRFRNGVAALAAATLAAGLGLSSAGAAQALDYGSLRLDQAASVGIHNTYDNSSYPYLADALDSGATLIELDAWVNPFTHQWDVSHSNPIGSSNNCDYAPTPADLYTGKTSQDLDSCLGDIATWLSVHPTANPIMIKLELKAGFDQTIGMGPAELDSYIDAHIGQYVYRPADLLTKPDGSQYPSLDAAAKAGNWPTRQQLQGKVIIEAIPGTFEQANPFDHLWTDTEYADYLSGLESSGRIGNAEIFPSVLGAQTGDPRSRYPAAIQPDFVVFDGDAATYVSDGNTEWYNANHYLVIATDAQNVSPALSDTAPSLSDAQARVAQLAADSVSFVSTDWSAAPGDGVLPEVLPRG